MVFFTVAEVNPDLDLVRGAGREGTELFVRVFDPTLPFPQGPDVVVQVDSSESWTAEFAGLFDILVDSCGWVIANDEDGDHTQTHFGLNGEAPDACSRSSAKGVGIDVKPGSNTNPVNPKSKDVIPVAILTTEDFDATTVDPMSVAFGSAEANEAHGRGHLSDVDHDGDIDLMLHFRNHESGIVCGDTSAGLTGQTFGGRTIEGTDAINTVGCE